MGNQQYLACAGLVIPCLMAPISFYIHLLLIKTLFTSPKALPWHCFCIAMVNWAANPKCSVGFQGGSSRPFLTIQVHCSLPVGGDLLVTLIRSYRPTDLSGGTMASDIGWRQYFLDRGSHKGDVAENAFRHALSASFAADFG